MLNYLGMPIQASTHAAELDHMSVLVHWLMLVLFVGWGAFFLFVLFRFRKGANPTASYAGAKGKIAKGTRDRHRRRRDGPARRLRDPGVGAFACRDFPSENEAVVVRVSGEQFAWNSHYPGADGQFGRTDIKLVSPSNAVGLDRTDPAAKDDITTVNQLNLPVDRPILIRLTSKDVIHSFGLFEMRVKQDAVPGLDIPVWFIPNRVGDYEISCSQLCGLGHYRMRGFMSIKSDADYQAWLAEEAKLLTP